MNRNAAAQAGTRADDGSETAVGAPQHGPISKLWRRLGRRYSQISSYTRIASVATVFIAWEVVGRWIVTQDIFLVPITSIFGRMWQWFASGEGIRHLEASGLQVAIGFGLAVVLGLSIGIAMALSRTINDIIDPFVTALYSTPMLALTPLFIIWLGIGMASKVAIILLISMFPILINTAAGIRQTNNDYLDAARAFGASRYDLIRKVRLPSAVPYIIAGMRIGWARAVVGVFVAELFGARAGVGQTIARAAQVFDTELLFVGIIVLASMGVIGTSIFAWMEGKLAPWQAHRAEGAT